MTCQEDSSYSNLTMETVREYLGGISETVVKNNEDLLKKVVCIAQSSSEAVMGSASTELLVEGNKEDLGTISYIALGLLVPGLFLVILGSCISSRTSNNQE